MIDPMIPLYVGAIVGGVTFLICILSLGRQIDAVSENVVKLNGAVWCGGVSRFDGALPPATAEDVRRIEGEVDEIGQKVDRIKQDCLDEKYAEGGGDRFDRIDAALDAIGPKLETLWVAICKRPTRDDLDALSRRLESRIAPLEAALPKPVDLLELADALRIVADHAEKRAAAQVPPDDARRVVTASIPGPNLQLYRDLGAALDALIAEGGEDGKAADLIRDAMDPVYLALTPEEVAALRVPTPDDHPHDRASDDGMPPHPDPEPIP